MISQAQLENLKEGTLVSYGPFGKVFFVKVATHRDDGTAYQQPHVVMRDSKGNEKLVFSWLFCKYGNELSE
jgi:hypothetical protein